MLQVAKFSERVQDHVALLEPLIAPLEEIFDCASGAFKSFNWTSFKQAAAASELVGKWGEIFVAGVCVYILIY